MQTFHHWQSFLPFFSASSTQTYLKKCYQHQKSEKSEQKSFENCYPFIYYLEHGQVYYKQAEIAPLIIQPILLFYGFVHLIKACLLTADPNYPETTSVLAHGVSTRKKKKQQYQFFDDEVKFQKSGLFPHMADKLFNLKNFEKEKVTMGELLTQIPELNHIFFQMQRKNTFIKIDQNGDLMGLSKDILDHYHMTDSRFIDYWRTKTNVDIHFQAESHSNYIQFKLGGLNYHDWLPIKYNLEDHLLLFPLSKSDLNLYPELLIHYLLLYNLSMIARYETEWWSELIKTTPNQDYPFIQSFLNITSKKGPFLIYQILEKQAAIK